MSRGLFRLVGVWSGCWVVRDAVTQKNFFFFQSFQSSQVHSVTFL
jgi:hypothetical protein